MRYDRPTLFLENKDDEKLFYEMCEAYLFWYEGKSLNKSILEEKSMEFHKDQTIIAAKCGTDKYTHFPFLNYETMLKIFSFRDEPFKDLWNKILKCLEDAELIKIEY